MGHPKKAPGLSEAGSFFFAKNLLGPYWEVPEGSLFSNKPLLRHRKPHVYLRIEAQA
jgi:hypothetical protein